MIRLKRAYDAPSASDGFRILVDRLWPRGVKKDAAQIDFWFKDIAPSTELRQWFGHAPVRWVEFRKLYFNELERRPEAVAKLLGWIRTGTVTFVYGAKDSEHNHALALKDYLASIQPRSAPRKRATPARRVKT